MNTVSEQPARLAKMDKSKAEISFCLIPQNPSDEGFLERLLSEDVQISPVWQTQDGEVHDEEVKGGKPGAKFQVIVKPKATKTATKKATPKASE